jgi:hypothetical protein
LVCGLFFIFGWDENVMIFLLCAENDGGVMRNDGAEISIKGDDN